MWWQVGDRAATSWTRVCVADMWLAWDKSAFEGERPPPRWTRHRYAVHDDVVDGTRVWRVRPRWGEPRTHVLYLHGGGYVHPLTAGYWRLVRSLVSAGAEVVVPAYHAWMTRAIAEGRRTRRDRARIVTAVGTARHG